MEFAESNDLKGFWLLSKYLIMKKAGEKGTEKCKCRLNGIVSFTIQLIVECQQNFTGIVDRRPQITSKFTYQMCGLIDPHHKPDFKA
jgi:hypothetical protein